MLNNLTESGNLIYLIFGIIFLFSGVVILARELYFIRKNNKIKNQYIETIHILNNKVNIKYIWSILYALGTYEDIHIIKKVTSDTLLYYDAYIPNLYLVYGIEYNLELLYQIFNDKDLENEIINSKWCTYVLHNYYEIRNIINSYKDKLHNIRCKTSITLYYY